MKLKVFLLLSFIFFSLVFLFSISISENYKEGYIYIQNFNKYSSNTINVLNFGAKPNDKNDDTNALQLALNEASKNHSSILIPKGIYIISSLRIHNGVVSVYGNGAVLQALSSQNEAVIELDGHFFNTIPVENCQIYNLKINCNDIARRAVFAAGGVANCHFFNLDIYGLNSSFSENGIYLHFGAYNNRIYNNKIKMIFTDRSLVGIQVTGKVIDIFGGWGLKGNIAKPEIDTYKNYIYKNEISGGTHGIMLFGACNNFVYENIISRSSHRGVILSPLSSNNFITKNKIIDFGSSGIHMSYKSNCNLISENVLNAPFSYGEAGIQAYVGTEKNEIVNNKILCATNYGIYLGISSKMNTIENNIIEGGIKKAAICIENEWPEDRSIISEFSRPNYGNPPNNLKQWSNGNSSFNKVKNNVIRNLKNKICGICTIDFQQPYQMKNEISRNKIPNVLKEKKEKRIKINR